MDYRFAAREDISLIIKLAQIAVERGCGRLEWWCLDWNKPSIDFYLSMGAEPMSDWTVYRITGETLKELGESNKCYYSVVSQTQ